MAFELFKRVLMGVAKETGAQITLESDTGDELKARIITNIGTSVRAKVIQDDPIKYSPRMRDSAEKAIGSPMNQPERILLLDLQADLPSFDNVPDDQRVELQDALLQRAHPLSIAASTDGSPYLRCTIPATSSFDGEFIISPDGARKAIETALEMFDEQVPRFAEGIRFNYL